MESRGAAVLGLGQRLAPFGEHQSQEEAAASGPPWRGGGDDPEERRDSTAARRRGASAAGEQRPQAGEEEEEEEASLLALRRSRGRSLSLPASPSLAAARLFSLRRSPGDGDDGEGGGGGGEDDEEEDGAPSAGARGGCCTKCKKRVQFADSLGLCLASVKHFSAAEEPQVPPAVLSRLQSFPMRHKDLEEFSAALAELGARALQPSPPSPPPPPPTKAALQRVVSGLEGAGSAERLRWQRVCLEEAAGTALAGLLTDVRGVLRVVSCPGPKEVTVRYTFNEWLSFLDSPALPLPPDPEEGPAGPTERYQFCLCLPPGLQEGTAVHFAICYRNQQGEYWDNNGGANYTLHGCRSPEEKPTVPIY
ncbi:hypothetical protein JRQ81_012402 [Phrynocephalus forsythii]|uniref:CBM21 domain-containing protein n=1 Tax=Phrynocephalus forsythii TaxID=171643 RepID=A0A9Q0Y119_9SAUR|nr:hypothetical protein JRQ81_012402 [Phrynocephalus forsythii]